MFRFINKHHIAFILVGYSIAYLLVRLVLLDQLYMLHDERDIVFSGISLARTGADLYGRPFPLSFEGINPDNPLFSIWFSAISWLCISGQSVFLARLPFVLFSSSLPVLFYLISQSITKDKRFSLVFMLFATLNPWMYHLTRYAMDITSALPILLASIIMLLREKRYFGYVLLFLSCFNYQGFRIAIPFVLFACEWFVQHNSQKKSISWYIAHTLFLLVLFVSILCIDKNVSMARSDQIIFLNQDKFAGIVDEKRRISLAPLSISHYFDNKFTESVRYTIEGILNGVNVDIFFFQGDRSATNGTGISGLFFIIALPFFLYGATSLRKVPLSQQFLASFLLIGMAPSIVSVNGHTYGIRGSLMIIGFASFMTIGFVEIYKKIHATRWLQTLFIVVLAIGATLDIASFGYAYFYRRPILLGEMYVERERALTRSLSQIPKGQSVYVFDNEPKNLLMSYMFLTNLPFSIVHNQMRMTLKSKYRVGNIAFIDCDKNWKDKLSSGVVYLSNKCLIDTEYQDLQSKHLQTLQYTDTPLTAFFIIEK